MAVLHPLQFRPDSREPKNQAMAAGATGHVWTIEEMLNLGLAN